tara:strand:- start:425 stop:955 length:531 start_codon:yes stop_codon:yes gene_type:complete
LRLIIFIIFTLNFLPNIVLSQTIAVVNIQELIDNNPKYIDIINDIDVSRQKYLKNFQKEEDQLKDKFKNIEESKLILSDNEINLQINDYNNQLNNFTLLVDDFNLHYQKQVIDIREDLLNHIIVLLERFAVENKVDLILDSTSYLIVSNSLDITDKISNELLKINFELEYINFEEN